MGLAERFNDTLIDITTSALENQKLSQNENNLFALDTSFYSKRSNFDLLKNELFEKISNIPCWFEYDEKTQMSLIVKFLVSKEVKTPEVFAKVLQHSILGFGIFDEYLSQPDVSAIYYVEGEPLICTRNNVDISDDTLLPENKVNESIKNIINMSRSLANNGCYNFRFGNFWIELSNLPQSKVKFSIVKINSAFLEKQFKKSSLSTLTLDY